MPCVVSLPLNDTSRQHASHGGSCFQEMMRGEAQELVKASFGPTLLCTIGKVYESQAQVGTHHQGQCETLEINSELALCPESALCAYVGVHSWQQAGCHKLGVAIFWQKRQTVGRGADTSSLATLPHDDVSASRHAMSKGMALLPDQLHTPTDDTPCVDLGRFDQQCKS